MKEYIIEEEEKDDNKKENEKEEKEKKEVKEEKEEKEEKDSSEKDLLLIKKDSKSYENYDYRDILLLNDLDFFYKTGKIPFVFFTHLLCTILVTFIIIVHNENLNKLMQQSRAVQASFYLHEDTENPDFDFPKKFVYSKYETFSESLVKIINNIYDINKTINFDIIYDNQDDIKMFTKFKASADIDNNKSFSGYNGTFPYVFNITKNIEPLKQFFKNRTDVIKYFLSQAEQLNILLKYKYDRLNYGSCQIVNLNLIFDCSQVSFIKFYPKFEYDNCPLDFDIIKLGFKDSFSIFSLILIFSAVCEEFFILKKILSIVKIVFYIKENLSKENFLDNFTNEELFFRTGESKWDLIKNKDIFSLFPKWLFMFVLTGILNTVGGISFLFHPFLTHLNRIIFGFGSFFSWISFAYYFHSNHKYNLFYRTLFKSMSEYKYLFTTFLLLFTGFCLLNMCVNYHPGPYYNGFQGTFATVLAATLGDILIDIWYTTFVDNPILTLILGFIMFIVFLGNHFRVMFNVTQEMFQIANLETKKSWLDNSFDFKDYLNQQFNINELEEKEGSTSSGEKAKKDFVFDDAWMRAVLNIDEMNKLETIDLNNLKVKGLNTEAVVNSLKKLRKNNRNKKISKEIFKEILDEEGNTEMEKLDGKNKQISRAFKNIEKVFYRMYLKVKKDINFNNKEKFKEICQQSIEKLEEFKSEISIDW